ncbi:MAG TPA: hypothetical protein VHG72_07445 [Polyangia bacterium]|nr:hypothetical protein [Polyangia bacterium]
MINSLGGEQDNVVFLGRRSFRMEIAGQPDDGETGIPGSMALVATQRLFAPERANLTRRATTSAPAPGRISRAALLALCSMTFLFGVAVTLTFGHRNATHAMPAATAARPAPAPVMVVQPLATAVPAALPAVTNPPIVRSPAKPPRAVRPRLAPPAAAPHAAHPAPAPKPWVDPFAE